MKLSISFLLQNLRNYLVILFHCCLSPDRRTLLWLGILFLPLLGATWVLAVLSVSEDLEILHYFFSVFSLLTALFVLVGYCLLNSRVRDSLYFMFLACTGRKVPYQETLSVTRPSHSSVSAFRVLSWEGERGDLGA